MLAAGLVVVALCALPGAALATGSGTIASAPTMVYGQQEFGNTATDNPNAACVLGHGVEAEWAYWLTPSLTAGDQLTVDFGGLANLYAYLYPVGTTDYNVSSTDWVANANAVDTQHGEVRYLAPRDGVMPLEFLSDDGDEGCAGGPYNFTASVTHELVLSLQSHSNRGKHLTTFTVTIHSPDGASISASGLHASYQYRSHGRWQTIKQNAPLTFTGRWARPLRGKFETVRVTVSGPSYRSASASIRVKAV